MTATLFMEEHFLVVTLGSLYLASEGMNGSRFKLVLKARRSNIERILRCMSTLMSSKAVR